MSKIISRTLQFLLIVFIFPTLLHLGLWSMQDRPSSWRNASWSSAGILPEIPSKNSSNIYVFSARTGGIKGALATHSWIVMKKYGAVRYDRYDVVGWGAPVRKNAYDADGRWYSNLPTISHSISGTEAARLIPKIETAIKNYRWSKAGDYALWPGPNSNTFVASIIRAVPGFAAYTPTTAIGRDFPVDGRWAGWRPDGALFASAGGYAGLVIGIKQGLEINFLGLVAGLNPWGRELKIPAFGAYRW